MAVYQLGQAGMVLKDAWASNVAYEKLNVVAHRNGMFICKQPCTGIQPAVTSGWSNYWVLACNGIYNVTLTNSSGTVTATYTMSDGTTKTGTYPATTIQEGGITSSMIANGAVGTAAIENGSIETEDLSQELIEFLNSLTPVPFVAGTTAPTNTNQFWIDTNANTGGIKYYNGTEWKAVPFQYT